MSGRGAYGDEMAPLRDLDDRDLDRLLAGRSVVGGEAADLAELVRDVRLEHLRPMAPDVEARHVSAMAQAARGLSSTEQPTVVAGAPKRPRRGPGSLLPKNRLASAAAAIAAVTVTAGLGTAGLAVAGVDLPDAARDVFRQVGVTLPNQDEPSEARGRSREARAAAVRAVIAATPPSEREGCAFGQRVAEAARGEALPAEAKEACAAQEARRAEREQEPERTPERDTPPAASVDAPEGDGDGSGAERSDRTRRPRPAPPQGRQNPGQDTAERAPRRDRGTGGNGVGNNRGGSPPQSRRPEPRPESQNGEAPSSRGRPRDDAGPANGRRGGTPEGAGRPEGSGGPPGAGTPPGEGRGRPEGAGRP